MKLPLNLAKILQQLINDGELPYSRFNGKLVDKFIDDGILESSFLSRTKRNVRLRSLEYLNNYLFNHYGISDLSTYISTMSDDEARRSDYALAAADSKIKGGTVFTGFLINSYEEIYGTLKEEKILLKPTPGSFIFINDYKNLSLPEDIIIVVIENFENFKFIEHQKAIFPSKKKLFTWRYQNNALSEWLSSLPNPYIHFGDFDLSGLKIYLNFKQKRACLKSAFLVPENIEELIEKYGSRERYLKQLSSIKNINFSEHEEVLAIIELINKYQKSLEQEIFIKLLKEKN